MCMHGTPGICCVSWTYVGGQNLVTISSSEGANRVMFILADLMTYLRDNWSYTLHVANKQRSMSPAELPLLD